MTNLTTRLAEAEAEVHRLEAELAAAQAKWYDIRCEQYDIHIGDRVRCTRRGDNGAECIVTKITFSRSGPFKPWVEGSKIKKDGTPGLNILHCYGDWEKVDG